MLEIISLSEYLIWSPKLFSGLILIVFSVYVYFKLVLYSYWRRKGLFYIQPTFPIGNIFATVARQKYLGDIYEEAYHKYKNLGLFGMYTFHKPSLVIANPELIRIVLTKEFSNFHDRGIFCNEKIDPLGAHLFMLPGSKWRNLRIKLTPAFSSGKMKRMFHIVKNHGVELSKVFERNIGKEVELRDMFARYTTDVIVTTVMGVECNSLENPENEFRYFGRRVFEQKPIRNACVVFAPKVLEILKIPFTPKAVEQFFLRVFEGTVEYRRRNNVISQDFMDLLIQLINNGDVDKDGDEDDDLVPHISESTEGKMSVTEAASQAYVFFIAGFETSATLVAHCIYELVLNQEIQDLCRSDINASLDKHGGEVTYDSIKDMPYLHKVLQESMRKYPAVGGLNRICTKETVLPSGFRIEKGIDIFIPVQGIHRDPDIYPDPDRFDPDRFTAENCAKRHPYTYLPFGEGPRICIGLRFALMQTKIAVINSLRKFQFVKCTQTPDRLKIDPAALIAVPDGPIHVRIEKL